MVGNPSEKQVVIIRGDFCPERCVRRDFNVGFGKKNVYDSRVQPVVIRLTEEGKPVVKSADVFRAHTFETPNCTIRPGGLCLRVTVTSLVDEETKREALRLRQVDIDNRHPQQVGEFVRPKYRRGRKPYGGK